MKILPLLLCGLSAAVQAGGMSPLVVAPDLVRAQPAAGAGAVVPAPLPRPASSQAIDAPVGTNPVGVGVGRPDPRPQARPSAATAPAASGAGTPGQTEVRALRITGVRTVELVAEGDAQMRRDDIVLTADRLAYDELLDQVTAEGKVRVEKGDGWLTGSWAQLILHEWVGELRSPAYSFKRRSRLRDDDRFGAEPVEVTGSGRGDALLFEGENQYRLANATWSTCEPDDPAWYIQAEDLELDYDREIGRARGSKLVFKDVPILWWPWIEFPLAEQRQSGFLVPTVGMSNKTGLDISVPYYWNIAPNYDATLAPRFMGRRGLQLAGEFRYLTPVSQGQARLEWLPSDRVSGERRSLASFQHQQMLSPRLYASVDYNGVSDDQYFEDLSTRVSVASKVNLLREAQLHYNGGWWNLAGLVQSYQTLSGDDPYRRLPQIQFNTGAGNLPGGAQFAFAGEYARFAHADADRAEGDRLTLYPQVSFPFERPGYYLTPRISLHHTRYELDHPLVGGRKSITRSLPILSVDGGLFFDRTVHLFGHDYQQSLEPRLFYVKVPYSRQDDIPVFDSARYDFGFAQIFSEMRYAGGDRIADSNQLTAAVTTRLIEPATGIERLRLTLGQRYYFSDQRVSLNELGRTPVESLRTSRRTDLLAALSSRMTPRTAIESAWQYSPSSGLTERFNFYVRHQRGFAKALNFGYRFSRDVLEDLDVSAQWPLGGRWYGVGRITRSLKEKRVTEAIGGVEYLSECGCWILRTAVHRFATNPDRVTNALFVQLELKGLGSVGNSPLSLLRRSVPGYGRIDDPISDRFFGAE